MEQQEDLRLPMAEPYRFDDCGWVANRWCELLPMQSELKQRLMEYYKKTSPLIGYYYAKGKLSTVDALAEMPDHARTGQPHDASHA